MVSYLLQQLPIFLQTHFPHCHFFPHSGEAMGEALKSQLTKFILIVVLLIITPLLSTSMRPPYLYLLVNLLIISLGTQSGLLSFHNKPVFVSPVVEEKESADKCSDTDRVVNKTLSEITHQKINIVEEESSVIKVEKVKKSSSLPSLFFIGCDEVEAAYVVEHEEEGEEEELGAISEQELFLKAETFIGNFYKQLRIQREESWNKTHGFYQQMAF